MFDQPARLIVAYGILAFLALAVGVFVWWSTRNTRDRRDARARDRLDKVYRRRDEAKAATTTDH